MAPSYRDSVEFGSTPTGVYFYQADAFKTPGVNFGAGRKHVHVARSLVPVLNLRDYTKEQLRQDLATLRDLVGKEQIEQILRRWPKYKSQFGAVATLPAAQFWYVLTKIWDPGDSGFDVMFVRDPDDPDDAPSFGDVRYPNDAVLANRLLRALGYRAVMDPGLGIIYSGEPVQTFFTDDDAFELVDAFPTKELVRQNPTLEFSDDRLLLESFEDLHGYNGPDGVTFEYDASGNAVAVYLTEAGARAMLADAIEYGYESVEFALKDGLRSNPTTGMTAKGRRMERHVAKSGSAYAPSAVVYAAAKRGTKGLVTREWAKKHGYPSPNPAVAMHPDLFEGESPIYVSMEKLSPEQIRALPLSAFNEKEWESLDPEDQNYIIENDPKYGEIVEQAKEAYEAAIPEDWDWSDIVDDDAEEMVRDDFGAMSESDFSSWVAMARRKSGDPSLRALIHRLEEAGMDSSDVADNLVEALADESNWSFSAADWGEGGFLTYPVDEYPVEIDWSTYVDTPMADLPVAVRRYVARQIEEYTEGRIVLDERDIAQRYGTSVYVDTGRVGIGDPDLETIEESIKEDVGLNFVDPRSYEERKAATYRDGFYIVELTSPELRKEGEELGHCVSDPSMGYMRAIADGEARIYSLRTGKDRSKFTIEVQLEDDKPYAVVQVKGKANRVPGWGREPGEGKFKIQEVSMLLDFIENKLGLDPEDVEDMEPALQHLHNEREAGRGQLMKINPGWRPSRTFCMPSGGGERSADCPHGRCLR
ncbi:MAG: PcfJ domain-containing protein [Kiloniellales bacterium]|nr:PcfJ domain-containing protein [Kiloniellales bacterium]